MLLYFSPRVIDHYLEGSVLAYSGGYIEEIIAAEQSVLTEGERPPRAPRQEAPLRAQEGCVTEPKGRQAVKKAIALKLLKSKKARQLAMRAVKNEKVRKVVLKQVSRRLTGK